MKNIEAKTIDRSSRVEYNIALAAILYYWSYLYFRVLIPPPNESIVAYLFTVAPIVLFSISGMAFHFYAHQWKVSSKNGFFWLVLFYALAFTVSAARGDVGTIQSAGLLTLSLIWLSNTPSVISLILLNRLLLASIAMGGLFHTLGLSEYGILPGQYAAGEDRGIMWRVSLFPFVPESGFFATIVLIANQISGRGLSRYFFGSLALYFLVFSGVRSAMIGWLLVLIFLFFDRNRHIYNISRLRNRRLSLTLVLLTIFTLTVIGANLLSHFPNISGTSLGNYILREGSEDINHESINKSVYRSWLWLQHIDIFLKNPLLGIGTYDFNSLITERLFEDMGETGSESFLTLWLSKLGLVTLPLIVFFIILINKCANHIDQNSIAIYIILLIAMLAYGSFLVPYNFMFIVIFSSIISLPYKPQEHA